MKKIMKPILAVGALCATSGMGVSFLLTLTSCFNNKETNNVVKINNQFVLEKKKLQNAYGLPKLDSDKQEIDDKGTLFIKNANNAIEKLTEYKNKNYKNLKLNEKIWLDSYIYNWKTEINNWKNGLQYLGGDPSKDALPLSPNSNHLDDILTTNLNIFKIDSETLEPIKDLDHVNSDLAFNYVNVGNNLYDYITSLTMLLKKGESLGIMENNISKKLFLNQMLTNYYPQELLFWQSNDKDNHGTEISLPINDKDKQTNALLANFDLWEKWAKKNYISDSKINVCLQNLNKAQKALDDFINWYSNTYFTSTKSYGSTSDPKLIKPLKIYKQNPPNNYEIEKTIFINNQKELIPIYGLGVTNDELDLQKIGLGYMNSSLMVDNKNVTGNDMYQALLQFNNSVDKTPTQLVNIGLQNTKDSINKMKEVGKQIAELNKNNWIEASEWKPKFWYRPDISSKEKAFETSESIFKDNKLNWTNFNHWLNQENFFFGRETEYWSQKYKDTTKTNLDAYTDKNTGVEFKKYLEILEKLGYAGSKGAWALNPNNPINGVEGNVDGKHALAGAVLSLFDYNYFKDQTKPLFTKSFNPIPDYNVAPYNIKIESIIGVGLEGPRGSNIFNYNVNPYYSLPKWSQSSFQDHEGSMGHHTQQSYWTKYMEGGAGLDNKTPGYTFKLDAYHEGWAVFTEWFAAELGVYGTWNGSQEQGADYLPTDWINAKGFVPTIENVKNPRQDEVNAIKNFQAGVYWSTTSGFEKIDQNLTDDQNHAIAAVKAANMLQYYGFKNEAQLRNMRLVVDPAFHYKANGSEKIDDENINYGSSIKKVREFLKNNSGLGEGDIKSESYRYLSMPAQATGYMTGKSILEQCYKAVKAEYAKEHQGKLIIDDSKEIKNYFDLILRNGEIPLDVVQQIVKDVYHVDFNENSLK